MYTASMVENTKRVVRAAATNQLARFFPRVYVQLTGETGRGRGEESAQGVAEYFRRCFDDYFTKLNIADAAQALRGRTVLEYGPGDVPAMALLMYAYGADKVYCVDRFPLVSTTDKNQQILQALLDSLGPEQRQRAETAFTTPGRVDSGIRPEAIEYLVRPSGLSGLREQADLVISRAVLEHVDDLGATFRDMHAAMKADATAIHQVDLKSHGLHQRNPLDFLTWPRMLWSVMYSNKGSPNRWRVDHYRALIDENRFERVLLEPTELAAQADIDAVRPHLAAPFRSLSDEDLAWLGFWTILRKPVH